MTRGLLDGITDPEIMARIAERRRVAERVAEQMGCTPSEAPLLASVAASRDRPTFATARPDF
jgi:hypothetical protein